MADLIKVTGSGLSATDATDRFVPWNAVAFKATNGNTDFIVTNGGTSGIYLISAGTYGVNGAVTFYPEKGGENVYTLSLRKNSQAITSAGFGEQSSITIYQNRDEYDVLDKVTLTLDTVVSADTLGDVLSVYLSGKIDSSATTQHLSVVRLA